MDFTKIKYTPPSGKKRPRVHLAWVEEGLDEHGDYAMFEGQITGDLYPHPGFLAALQGLRPALIAAFMLPDLDPDGEDIAERIEVRSVTVKTTKEGTGVVLSGLRHLDWIITPANLVTPFASPHLIPCDGFLDDLGTLREEAAVYLHAYREAQKRKEQHDLFEQAQEGFQDVAGSMGDGVTISAVVDGEETVLGTLRGGEGA